MTPTFTAFHGQRRLASGSLGEVALAVKRADGMAVQPILIFSGSTGRAIDLDPRGSDEEMLARLPETALPSETPEHAPPGEPRGRGRPKLGVVAREVTLLPRHWEWLARSPAAHRWRSANWSKARGAQRRPRIVTARRRTPPIVSCRQWPATSRISKRLRAFLFADDISGFAGEHRRIGRRIFATPHREARHQQSRRRAG